MFSMGDRLATPPSEEKTRSQKTCQASFSTLEQLADNYGFVVDGFVECQYNVTPTYRLGIVWVYGLRGQS